MKTAIIGSFVVDLMARTPHLPEPGETVLGTYFKAGPGGKGSNQAIAARRAGGDIVFSTKLGQDDFARVARSAYEADGISQAFVFDTAQVATGIALISVDEITGQNQIIVVPGACNAFDAQDIARLEEALDGCGYLLMQLEINADATERLIGLAYRKNVRVILNTAPVSPIGEALYPKLFMVTPNEVEARILTDIPCDTLVGCRKAAAVFLRRGVKHVIITRGKQGVFGTDGETEFLLDNYDVKVVDTTGAGDAFNGGLLAGLSKGMSIEDAARYANVVANLSVTKIGTAPSMPTQEEIDRFLRANGTGGAQ